MQPSELPQTLRESLLMEFDIAERQLLALANAIPAGKYSWRPADSARSVSEVLVHVAAGKFYILHVAGQRSAAEFYGRIAAEGPAGLAQVITHNDVLEKTVTEKEAVVILLTRALGAVREAITSADEADLAQPVMRLVCLRMIAHSHEHMGQMIAYTRMLGMPVPWHDWRPDRR